MALSSTRGGWPRTRGRGAVPAACALALAALCAAAPCRADDQQAFELAKNPFDAGKFEEAHARLSALLDPANPPCDTGSSATGHCRLADPDLIEQARALDAASLLAQKRDTEADAQIARILKQNPLYRPNPALFPQEVIDRFTTVYGVLRPELEAKQQQKAREEMAKRLAAQKAREADEKWIAELERLAAQEKVVTPGSRWIALVPLGVGQFQNGDVRLGVVFAAGEALLGGASLVTLAIVNKLASTDVNANPQIDVGALNSELRTAVAVNRVTFAGWVALTLAGVIQAQIAFVPASTTVRKHPIPPRPSLAPVAAPVPGGAVLGLHGTF